MTHPDHDAARAVGDFDPNVHVPGVWRCAKCGFRLIQSNLNAGDGSISARNDAGDNCPNDGAPMWRVTWKEDAQDAREAEESAWEQGRLAGLRERDAELARSSVSRSPLAEIAEAMRNGTARFRNADGSLTNPTPAHLGEQNAVKKFGDVYFEEQQALGKQPKYSPAALADPSPASRPEGVKPLHEMAYSLGAAAEDALAKFREKAGNPKHWRRSAGYAAIRKLAQMDDASVFAAISYYREPHPKGAAPGVTDVVRATLLELRVCAASWEPKVCVMGNVRAGDVVSALTSVLGDHPPGPAQGSEGGGL